MHVHSTTHLVIYAPDYDAQLTPVARERMPCALATKPIDRPPQSLCAQTRGSSRERGERRDISATNGPDDTPVKT
jgi:hypothetical protein